MKIQKKIWDLQKSDSDISSLAKDNYKQKNVPARIDKVGV